MRGHDLSSRYAWRRTSARTRRSDAATPLCGYSAAAARRARHSATLSAPAPAGGLAVRAARDVEEHLLHVGAAVARDQLCRRALVDDHAGAQHDHVVAHPLDFAHVVRREQHRAAGARAGTPRGSVRIRSPMSGRATPSARRAAAPRARSAPPWRARRACAGPPTGCRRAASAARPRSHCAATSSMRCRGSTHAVEVGEHAQVLARRSGASAGRRTAT